MKPVTILALATILAATSAFALPAFEGMDQKGNACAAVAAENGTMTFRTGTGYVFAGIPLKAEPNRLTFDAITVQRQGRFYSPPIGAPISIGNIGIVRVSGAILLGADGLLPTHWEIHAVGGIANWWRKSFTCASNGVER